MQMHKLDISRGPDHLIISILIELKKVIIFTEIFMANRLIINRNSKEYRNGKYTERVEETIRKM